MSVSASNFEKITNYQTLTRAAKADYGFDVFVYSGIANCSPPTEDQFNSLFNWYKDYVKTNGCQSLHQLCINRNIRNSLPSKLKWFRSILEVYH